MNIAPRHRHSIESLRLFDKILPTLLVFIRNWRLLEWAQLLIEKIQQLAKFVGVVVVPTVFFVMATVTVYWFVVIATVVTVTIVMVTVVMVVVFVPYFPRGTLRSSCRPLSCAVLADI